MNQSLEDVEVVLTDRITTIRGTVDERRERVREGTHVLVFSTDRARWYPASRHLQHGVTSPAGEFTFTGVPPGSYFAVALAAIPAGDDAWQDPMFLDSIRPAAAVISIGEGVTDTVALRMTPP